MLLHKTDTEQKSLSVAHETYKLQRAYKFQMFTVHITERISVKTQRASERLKNDRPRYITLQLVLIPPPSPSLRAVLASLYGSSCFHSNNRSAVEVLTD